MTIALRGFYADDFYAKLFLFICAGNAKADVIGHGAKNEINMLNLQKLCSLNNYGFQLIWALNYILIMQIFYMNNM